MSDVVAFRYAKVFHLLANDSDCTNRVVVDVELITGVFANSKEFKKSFMEERNVPLDYRVGILEKVIKKKLSQPTLLFINFLEHKKRLSLFSRVLYFFNEFEKQSSNVLEVELTKSNGLARDFEVALERVLKEKYDKEIRLVVKENQSLIGGFLLKIGDVFYDLSVKGKLNSYKAKIL